MKRKKYIEEIKRQSEKKDVKVSDVIGEKRKSRSCRVV
jgi:hypothetical protein